MRPPLRSRYRLLVAAAVVSMLGGCAAGLTQQQQMWLAQGQEYYERDDYGRAIDQLTRFLSEVNEGPEVSQALYVRGMSNAQAGHRRQAHADLRRCAATPTDSDLAGRAYLVLGTLHFEDEQWSHAAQNLRAAAERMPAQPPKDAVLFRLGLCHERMGQWPAALRFYGELARTFTIGTYVKAAQRRLRLGADHFAVQCGAFRQKSNAENFRADLEQKGLEAHIREEVRGRTAMYVVLVGRYGSYEEARRQLVMIKEHFVSEEFVSEALLWP